MRATTPFLALGLSTVSLAASIVPQKLQLSSRRSPRGSSARRRAVSPVNVPLSDAFNGTDLQCVISIG